MTESDKAAFSETIAAMVETYGQECTKPMLTGYWLGLRDLAIDDVRTAVAQAITRNRYRPVPAELRELALGMGSEDQAIAAWGDVQRSANVSYMVALDFKDYLINATIRQLGGRTNFYNRLNESADSEKWLRVEFLKTYASLARQPPSPEACKVLAGEAQDEEVSGRRARIRCQWIGCDDTRVGLLPPRAKMELKKQSSGLLELRKA